MEMRNPIADSETCYQAVLSRDYRFDGKFFVAVRTTGVYCRPVCPARPKRENVEFFPTAQAAEKAGYRPCLRCRPESAPGSPAWNGRDATIERALKLLAEGALEQQTEEVFAGRLGMTARHLRRLFERELGQTPKQLHDNARLNFARKLIVETHLPITEIAFSAGFRSLRRFNDAVKKRFHRPPSSLRSARPVVPTAPMIRLTLSYRPPLDWDGLLRYFGRHAVPGVESLQGNSYARVFRLGGTHGCFRVIPRESKPQLLLEAAMTDNRQLLRVVQRVRRMFDLDSDPVLIANAFARLKVLPWWQEAYAGARLARGFDAFETAIATILGQVIAVPHARRLQGQLVERYGEEIIHPLSGDRVRVFPTPDTLADADLAPLKITRQKREAIREFSSRVAEGTLDLDRAPSIEDFKASVRGIRGIGAWTAEYMALRALGDTDAFPQTDLILSRFMKANPDCDLQAIRPWRGYLATCLWDDSVSVPARARRRDHAVI